ncbi:hypothetical protein [Archangium lansingense]|uniref:Lipoprotein n=1 Tax=Archangium lansingense TaxID=2995310 RepID=A0ABT4AK82_9BACT|nr:hypothetical protein [Archangium lansinium]MCY1082111.1 hypothetical protein [Archangium lansinium]
MSSSYRSRRVVVPLLLSLLVTLGACKRDKGPEQLARAEAKHAELVERGVPPKDPAWDAVISELEKVPPDSKAYAEAQRRLTRLRELRSTPLPRRPLSRPGVPEGGSTSLDEHGHPMHPHPENADGGR